MKLSHHRIEALIFLGATVNCASPVVPPVPDMSSSPPPVGPSTPPFTQPVVVASTAPPPITGGTLLVSRDGTTAVAADPGRDVVWLVDLLHETVKSSVALRPHDEPGRLVEDGAAQVHVALRGGHAVATISLATGELTMRREACEEPRGIAFDGSRNLLHVACATGTLVTFDPGGAEPIRRLALEPDLRDVVIDGDRLLVSRFRAADLLVVDGTGAMLDRWQIGTISVNGSSFAPDVAWRTIAAPGGGAIMAHQSAATAGIGTTSGPAYYGSSGCGSIVSSHVSSFSSNGAITGVIPRIPGALPVDVAITADGRTVAAVAAGNASLGGTLSGIVQSQPQIFLAAVTFGHGDGLQTSVDCSEDGTPQPIPATQAVTALAFDSTGNLVYQTSDPPTIGVVKRDRTDVISLPGQLQEDTGHLLFHRSTTAGLACASCHPEGGDDGHTWSFLDEGFRRTQSLRVGLQGTEPFHWGGDMKDFSMLVDHVMRGRMSGPELSDRHVGALSSWINGLRPWQPPSGDAVAVERGRILFQQADTGCATCHAGSKYTNNSTVDVGTGEPLQVPSLVGVGFRAPYLHNGCAATLSERFGSCGGGDSHGRTSQLTSQQKSDLVAYLQSL